MNIDLINTALGKAPAEMIIKNGTVINVHTREVYPADVAISHGRIAAVGELPETCFGSETIIINAEGKFISPGFIDAHIHVESSMLTYTEFVKMVLPLGTTTVASDLMEATIVSGIEGMKAILKEASSLPVNLLYPVPSFMEDESEWQTTGSILDASMIEELLDLPEAIGLAEVLVPPVLAGSPVSQKILEAARLRKLTAEGHAPALSGANLNAYASAGIRSDHESGSAEEALGKLRAGLRVLMREGAAASDLSSCLEVITKFGVDSRHCAMISDDIDAYYISRNGHMDHKVRMAVDAGVDPLEALQMVTLNPAESLKIDDEYGSVSPGKVADIVILDSLATIKVDSVVAKGQLVVEGGALKVSLPAPEYDDILLHTINLQKPLEAGDLMIHQDRGSQARVRVIGADRTSLLTEALEATLPIQNGVIQPDPSQDILSIACVERYGKNGSVGKSFIKGFGLKSGAIATSVGHDHHNLTALGADPADMALAINRIAELDGGLVVAENGKILSEIALPLCGLLTPTEGNQVAAMQEEMYQILKKLGVDMPSPFMTLSFITLIFIPAYGITDQGLMDVDRFEIVDPVLGIS